MVETMNNVIIENMKNGNKTIVAIARIVKTELMTNQKSEKPKSDVDVLKSVKKKLTEEMETFKNVEDKLSELKIQSEWLDNYLPKMASKEDISDFLSSIEEKPSNIGMVMKMLKEKFGDSLDGKIASEVAREFLK